MYRLTPEQKEEFFAFEKRVARNLGVGIGIGALCGLVYGLETLKKYGLSPLEKCYIAVFFFIFFAILWKVICHERQKGEFVCEIHMKGKDRILLVVHPKKRDGSSRQINLSKKELVLETTEDQRIVDKGKLRHYLKREDKYILIPESLLEPLKKYVQEHD